MVGKRVGAMLGIPVYLYDAAAQRPDRVTLPQVRRDRYEILRQTIQTDPSRAPDYGPAHLGTAGAVAIGARQPLIAFNIYLDTDNVEIARAIAHAVRESGGGLKHVRALGLFVNGQAQVSLNLTDFRVTGLHPALEAVRTQAAKHSVHIIRSELVGLMPQQALFDAALSYLQLPPETDLLVLERRMGDKTGDYRPIWFE
jgi:glutamate formiminotransferase